MLLPPTSRRRSDGGGHGCGAARADLLPLVASLDPIESAVGLACVNALVDRDRPDRLGGDVLGHLDLGADDDVAMVGHFAPLVEAIRARARSLAIFEAVEQPVGPLRPRAEAPAALRGCQVALITATSILNHTVDDLLAAAWGCREVALLGASTPLHPAAFAGTSVTLLSGVAVIDPPGVLRVVAEGGGMRQFRRHVDKVTLRVSRRAREETR